MHLATQESVAQSIRKMIEKRTNRITLTGLGNLANFTIRYLPAFSSWLLWLYREKIKSQYTMIGGLKVDESAQVTSEYQEIIADSDVEVVKVPRH